MATKQMTVVYVDVAGTTTAHLITTAAGAAAVEAEILGASNAAELETWEGDLNVNGAPAPVAASYQSVRDRAVLLFSTAAGSMVKVFIPAPQAGIFMSDGETVDPATIATLIAQVIADVVTPGGTALTAYVGGVRAQ